MNEKEDTRCSADIAEANLAELTDGHLALDRLGAAREEENGIEVALCERINEIAARLRAVPQPSGMWQSIETAPIGAKPHDQILVGFMGQFHWLSFVAFPNGSNTSAPGYAKPTHWMPIPALSLTRPQSALGQPLTVEVVDLLNPVAGDAK